MRLIPARDAAAFQRVLDDPSATPVSPAHERLLDLVGAIATQAPAAPARPDFVTDLRSALLREAVVRAQVATALPLSPAPAFGPAAAPPRAEPRRHRGLAVAAGVATLVAATSSVSYAAQQALPGQPLYPVKRVLEHAQVTLASDSGRTDGLIDHAGRRLQEARALTARGSAVDRSQVADTVSTFTAQASEAGHRALGSGDPTQVAELRRFAAASLTRLVALEVVAPASAHGALVHAASELVVLDTLAVRQCGSCGVSDLPPLTLPLSFSGSGGQIEIFPGFAAHGSAPVPGVSTPSQLGSGADGSPTGGPSTTVPGGGSSGSTGSSGGSATPGTGTSTAGPGPAAGGATGEVTGGTVEGSVGVGVTPTEAPTASGGGSVTDPTGSTDPSDPTDSTDPGDTTGSTDPGDPPDSTDTGGETGGTTDTGGSTTGDPGSEGGGTEDPVTGDTGNTVVTVPELASGRVEAGAGSSTDGATDTGDAGATDSAGDAISAD